MTRIYRHNPHTPTAALLLAAGVWCMSTPIAPAQSTNNPPTVTEQAIDRAISALLDNPTPETIDRASLHLRSDDPPGSRQAAAQAIAVCDLPPADLVAPLARALELSESSQETIEIIRALARYPTTDAIYAVMSFLNDHPDAPADERRAATRAAAIQTARPELAADEHTLADWWARFTTLPERDRRAEIAMAHARKIEHLNTQLDAAQSRLLDVYRRLFAQTPDNARSDLLAELMRAEQTNLRILGIELATRTILNAKPVGPKVAEAAALGLSHAEAPVRAASAALVDRLNLAEHAEPCAKALAHERDPLAASAMMRYLSRHPSPESADAALKWLTEQGPVADAATELILVLLRQNKLTNNQIQLVRDAMNARPASQLTPQSVALLEELGDRERIIPLLDAADPRVAAAAAAALGAHKDTLAIVLDAALARPDLFEPACRALMRHRPDAGGFADAASLQATNPQLKRDLLIEFAATLSPKALQQVADRTNDLPTRERYLRRAATPEFLNAPDDEPTRVKLAANLAHTRIELNDPAGALAVLEILPESQDQTEQRTRLIDTAHCMVWLNRLDDAESLTRQHQIPARAWLDGLESAHTLPHAPQIISRIARVYPTQLTRDESARVAHIASTLDIEEPTPEPPPDNPSR